jgi:hypothetical protein
MTTLAETVLLRGTGGGDISHKKKGVRRATALYVSRIP